jgi:hypothetical protein
MAQLTSWDEIVASTLKSDATIPEDLMDAIYNVTPYETPLLSRLQTAEAKARITEWCVDAFAASADNAFIEGIAHTAMDLTVPTRAANIVQTFYKGGQIADTERNVAHVGMDDPLTYYEAKHVVELKKDMEKALVRGSAITGDTDTACRMGGFLNVLTTNKTAMSAVTLTEEVFNNILELVWGNTSMMPNEVYVGPKLKRTISMYNTKVTRNIDASAKAQILTVSNYDSDFGQLRVFLHRELTSTDTASEMLVIDPNWFATGWLQPLRRETLSRDGLRQRFQMSAEFTLFYRNEKAGAAISGISKYLA